jgi:hypothetical protein
MLSPSTRRFSLARLFGALGLASLALAACKEEGIDMDAFPDAAAQTVCQAVINECDCQYENPGTYDLCVAILTAGGVGQIEAIDGTGLAFDGVCAQEAIDGIDGLNCKTPADLAGDEGACERPCKIWYGPMGKGGTCTSVQGNDNCKQGLTCGPNQICVDPCDEDDVPGVGEACFLGVCEAGAYCDDFNNPLQPVCVALPTDGQPCFEDPNEGFYRCAPNHFCDQATDPANPVCVELPGLGEACPGSVCSEDLICDAVSDPLNPVCIDRPDLGEECFQFQCDFGLACDTDVDPAICVNLPPVVCNYYDGIDP